MTYSLHMVSGPDPEQFTVGSEFPILRGPDGGSGGTSIVQRGYPTLSGPGTLGPLVGTNSASQVGLQLSHCRGFTGGFKVRSQISLPPFSESRLTSQFEIFRGDPLGFPLVGDSYAPTFVVSSSLISGGTGTIGPDQRYTPPAPTFSPPLGVHIDLQTQPFTSSDVELRRGARIRFSGSTSPAAANQLIRISYRLLDLNTEGTIAEVRTDEMGQFRWPAAMKMKKNKAKKKKANTSKKKRKKVAGWKPKGLGVYVLSASLVPQSADIGPSRSCGRDFTLKKK